MSLFQLQLPRVRLANKSWLECSYFVMDIDVLGYSFVNLVD